LVVLRYPAFPYQDYGHYSGRVSRVSRTPLQASAWAGLSPAAATRFGAGAASGEPNAGEQYYQVTVALDEQAVAARGYAQPLVAGMQIEAEVRLERRRLIEWLFGPLLGGSGV
jgi:membrane fusion protein